MRPSDFLTHQDYIAWCLSRWLENCERFSPEWGRRLECVQRWLARVGRPSLYATYDD